MNYTKQYFNGVTQIIEELARNEAKYEAAGRLLAEAVRKGKLIHVAGTEMHSSAAVQEIFFHEGCLANINPLFDPTFSVTHNASRSLYLKESGNCGRFLLEYYRNISPGDVLILVDNDGIGRGSMEAIEKAREMGLSIIAVTSREFSGAVDPACVFRGSPEGCLADMDGIDVAIDNKVPAFDTLVCLEKAGMGAGRVSAVANSLILNSILLSALQIIEREGIEADIWASFYDPGKAGRNEALIEKYYDKIKHV